MVTVEETIAVQETLPHAKFISLKDTPHPIEQVDPKILTPLIDEWFDV